MQNTLIYILFTVIPFSHIKLGEHLTLYELGLLMNLIMGPFFFILVKSKFRWPDVLMLVYALYGIVSVLVGSVEFYESARTYRYLTLGPVFLYFIIRFTPVSYDVIRRGLYFMAAGVFLQTLIVLRYVVTFKARPTGEAWFFFPMSDLAASIVTLGVLCSLAACALIYTRGEVKSAFKKAILYGGAMVLAAGMFAAASRMVVVVFMLLFPFAAWIWKSRQRRRHFAVGVYVLIGAMMLAIFSPLIWDQGSNAKQATRATQNVEEGRSLERVVDIDLYQQDIGSRLRFWGNLVKSAMDDPVFGKGTASHEVGKEGGYGIYISSAHNILVSALYTSGFIGLVLLIMQIAAGYKCVSIVPADNKQLAALGKFVMVGLTIVLFVSFTNDLTAGRGNIFMFLLAMAAKLAYSSPPPQRV
jgi:hypothetical protein